MREEVCVSAVENPDMCSSEVIVESKGIRKLAATFGIHFGLIHPSATSTAGVVLTRRVELKSKPHESIAVDRD